MPTRQTRIFVPSTEPLDDWAETLLGRVVRPLLEEFDESLQWFWFSRYGGGLDDGADCDLSQIPAHCLQPTQPGEAPVHRSLRLRYAIDPARLADFERQARQRIDGAGYAISDFRPYDVLADTGSPRFLGVEQRQPARAERRSRLVTQFYMATAQLVLDALVGPDANGRYRLETSDDRQQNPTGSTFQSIHHVFCNITAVPTEVHVFRKDSLNVIGFGTYMHAPPAPEGGWDGATPYPVWF